MPMPYALLLLDEGSAITLAVGLLKAVPVVVLYGASFYFLLHNRRMSEQKPLGLLLALVLAGIGLYMWPERIRRGCQCP
jgi:cyanate permease